MFGRKGKGNTSHVGQHTHCRQRWHPFWSHYTSGAIRRPFHAGVSRGSHNRHSHTLYNRIGGPSTVTRVPLGHPFDLALFWTSHGFVQSILTSKNHYFNKKDKNMYSS